jgi:hypothetical protein
LESESGREIVARGRRLFGVEEARHVLQQHASGAVRNVHGGSVEMKRADIFARDAYRCVYCGLVQEPGALSVDHVQPRVRGGDGSEGNVVTACMACNTAKASRPLAQFLAENAVARRNFFRYARYIWPRHLRAVAEELARRGVVERPVEFVEGLRGLRSSEAIARMSLAWQFTDEPTVEPSAHVPNRPPRAG